MSLISYSQMNSHIMKSLRNHFQFCEITFTLQDTHHSSTSHVRPPLMLRCPDPTRPPCPDPTGPLRLSTSPCASRARLPCPASPRLARSHPRPRPCSCSPLLLLAPSAPSPANKREMKASARTHAGAVLFPMGVLRYHNAVSKVGEGVRAAHESSAHALTCCPHATAGGATP